MLVQEIEIFNSFQFFGKNIIETLIQFDINLRKRGISLPSFEGARIGQTRVKLLHADFKNTSSVHQKLFARA